MKKIAISTALATALIAPAAAMADTTLYGQFRYSFSSIDDPAAGIDGIQGVDNTSLFGLKGSKGKDVKAFFHIQTGAKADKDAEGDAFNQRFYFAGFSGGFGKVAFGRMTNAYKFPGFKLDPFYNLASVNAVGKFAGGGATYGLSPATNGFTDNALQYFSPSLGGLTVNLGTYIDDSNADEHGFGAGVAYKTKRFNVGVQYASNAAVGTIPNVAADDDAIRVHGGLKLNKKFSAGFSYEMLGDGNNDETNYLYVTGTAALTPKAKASLSYGSVDAGAAEGTGITAGLFLTVAPKAQVFLVHSNATLDAVAAAGDPSATSIGTIIKF